MTRQTNPDKSTLQWCSMTAHCSEDPARCDFGGRRPAIHAAFTQAGIGTVRTWPPLPTKSMMAQCPCLICKSSTSRPDNSARRNPQPRSTEIIAKSRTDRNPSPICGLQQGSRLIVRQPVSSPRAQLLHTFDPTNARSEFRTEQPGISGLIG
jgi:hypothetical protein